MSSTTTIEKRGNSTQPEYREMINKIVTRFFTIEQPPWGAYTLDLTLEALATYTLLVHDTTYKQHILDIAHQRNWVPAKPVTWDKNPPFTWLLFEIYRLSDDQGYVDSYIQESYAYMKGVNRLHDGTIVHPRGDQRGGGFALLIDHLQEYSVRMAKAGYLSNNSAFFEECIKQYTVYQTLLRNAATGLWSQGKGWVPNAPSALSPGAWSRGHGWLIRGMVESLLYLPPDSSYNSAMKRMLEEIVDALFDVQDQNGMWHAMLHLPFHQSPPESSGSGLIAYSIARAVYDGFLPRNKYLRPAIKAITSLKSYVTNEGAVLNCCYGPGPLTDIAPYCVDSFPANDKHGAGALIYAFTGGIISGEVERAEKKAHR